MSHYVDFTIERDGYIKAKARCTDLDCDHRKVCDRSECEEGCVDPAGHELRQLDYCNIETFLNEDDVIDCYQGPEVPLKNGQPVEVTWTGSGYDWQYQDSHGNTDA